MIKEINKEEVESLERNEQKANDSTKNDHNILIKIIIIQKL